MTATPMWGSPIKERLQVANNRLDVQQCRTRMRRAHGEKNVPRFVAMLLE